MNLQSGKLYWSETVENTPTYPKLEENIVCDVLIIGAGSSGAQVAFMLKDSGLNIVVVDKRKVGTGSTSTNTSLIQYLGDKTVTQLVNTFGEKKTFRHFKLCEQAIQDIESISNTLPINPDYIRRDSLYYASYEEDINGLKSDYNYLKKHDFKVDWLDENDIAEKYPFKKRAAIYSYNDGEMNPLKYVYGLLEACKESGVRVYEQTVINSRSIKKEGAVLYTEGHHEIQTKHVVFACGYESIDFKKQKNAVIESSYAMITTPISDFSSWYNKTLIWETARPYIYMRTTPDNRVIIGGLDESTDDAEKRDSKIIHKRDKLLKEFNKLFPDFNVEADYYLGAYYGGTHDGLPIIGIHHENPNCYYIYGYGDNGTVYNYVLGKIVVDLIKYGKSENLDLYLQSRQQN
ncbi:MULTISPECIES: NAD(P)/FAD-dependent oxidoreductase [Bacillus]|uniref:NAD(P)/FAD-dependent oxidoreductase n=1 Tax=Bacillus TaxID=1386 RepID=UPI000BB91CD4|nr:MULTISPECIES: FAD-dependent oxidoreductase [Bacillus]